MGQFIFAVLIMIASFTIDSSYHLTPLEDSLLAVVIILLAVVSDLVCFAKGKRN